MFTKCLFLNNKLASWKITSGKLLAVSNILCAAPNLEVVRFRARKGTRAAALAAKKAKKLQDSNKPAPIPKYLQRKVKVSAELEKVRCINENWLDSQPVDNVWNMKLYRGKPYSVSEALNIFKDMHIPALLNDPSAYLYVTTELDLKLKKKERFMDEFTGIITYPHEFQTHKKNRIIAICKEESDQMKAIEAGAVYAGSTTLIKQILSGALSSDDFDYVVCHPDMYKECNTLRGILKKRFPTANNGLLRLDIDKAVVNFIKGVEYTLKRSTIEPDFGWVDLLVGRLDMPFVEVEKNFEFALQKIQKHKSIGTSHLFVLRSLLWCEKTKEKIKVPHWKYLPDYPENGILLENDDEDSETAAEKSG